MRGGKRSSRDGRNDRRYSERGFRDDRNGRNDVPSSDRQFSCDSTRPPYNGRGNPQFERGNRGRSAAPIAAEKEPDSRPPPHADKPAPPERQTRDDYGRRMPAHDVREFRSNVRQPLSEDRRRQSTSSHPNTTPTKPIELLAPENIRDSICMENNFFQFTGGVNLNLMGHQKDYIDVEFADKIDEEEKEKRQELVWLMEGLIEMINPARRFADVITFQDVVNEVIECASTITQSEANSLLLSYGIIIGQKTTRWLNALFYANCCAAGYMANDFFSKDLPSFKDLPKNVELELEATLEFADVLVKADLFLTEELARKVEEIRELTLFVKANKTKELAEKNVVFALTEPLDRLRFGIPVTEEEIYKIVDASVSEDFAHYLWIVDHCPENILHSARIADSIINGMLLNRLSRDQRPQRAFYLVMPWILASLNEDELCELAKKYMKREEKLENWSEMIYKGYLMSLKNTRDRSKETDIVLIKLLEAESPDDLKHFLLSCALVAEFNPRRCPRSPDNSSDSFCTRMARVFINDAISPQKRSLLLETLLTLPEPVKDQILAKEGSKLEQSLYHSVKAICTEMSKLSPGDVRKWGSLVIRELSKVLSPARMLSYAVLPCLKIPEVRHRAAALLPELLSRDKLRQELLEESEGLSLAILTKTALEQYEEPEGTGPQARYALIEEILKLVDVVLEGDVQQKIIDDVDAVFEEKKLAWQQYCSILHICFPRSQNKLRKPEIPAVVFSLDALKAFNITAILQSWPNPDSVRGVFERVFSDIFPFSNKFVLVSYAILSAAFADNSKIKDHFAFLCDFLVKRGELIPGKEMNNNEEVSEKEKETEEGEEAWLSKELSRPEVDADLRRTILRIAAKSQKFAKEAVRLEKILFPPKNSLPEGTSTVTPSQDTEDKSNRKLSLETVTAPDSSSQQQNETDPKTKNSSIVSSIDYEGFRFPEVFKSAVENSDDSFHRCVLWLNEDLARTSDDLVGFVKSSKFQNIRLHRIVFYIGGRLPDIPANRNKKPLPNADLPLYVEIQARPAGKESERRLRDSVECAKTALEEFISGVSRCRRDSRDEHSRHGGRGGRQRGGQGRPKPSEFHRQGEGRKEVDPRGSRRENERNRRYSNEFVKKVVLKGVSDEIYDQKLDIEKVRNLRTELGCGIDILGYCKNWRELPHFKREMPIGVRITARDEQTLEKAERRIKEIFNL